MRKAGTWFQAKPPRRGLLIVIGVAVALWLFYAVWHAVLFRSSGEPSRAQSIDLVIDSVFFVIIVLAFYRLYTGRRRVENRAQRFVDVVEQIPSAVVITDLNQRIEYVNPYFTEMTGYSLEETIGQASNFLRSGQTPGEVYAELWRTLEAGREWRGEFLNRKKDGTLYWELNAISPLFGPDGEPTHYLAVKTDITARKAMEAAEREQRALAEALRDTAAALNSTLEVDRILERILENVGRVVPHDVAVIMLLDEHGETRAVHSHDTTGQGMDRWAHELQLKVSDVPDLRRVLETKRAHVAADTFAQKDWIVFPEAHWIRSNAIMPIVRHDRVIGFLELDSAEPGYFKPEHAERLQAFADEVAVALRNAELFDELQDHADTLEQRVEERTRELAQQRAQLRTILEGLGEGVSYTDGTQVNYMNQAMLVMLGYPPDAPPENVQQFAQILESAGLTVAELQAEIGGYFARGEVWRRQLTLQRRDGTSFEAALTAAPVAGRDGEVVGTVTIMRDISQEHALQARKHRFLTHAAHELRTPIANLNTRLYLIRQNPARAGAHLDVLEHVAGMMNGIVDDLLELLRLGRDDGAQSLFRALDLCMTLAQVRDGQAVLAQERGVDLIVELPDRPVLVWGDPGQLSQAFTRIVSNAIQRSASETSVRVRLDADPAAGSGYASVYVHDGGPAIDAADINDVFEPFFNASQANASGVALGLAIAHEIVQAHRGEMTVIPGESGGSVLVVRLALAERVTGDPPLSSGD